MRAYISFLYDQLGNIGGIGGVWNVPDDFDADQAYASFCTAFKEKHMTKSGRLTERQRKTQARQWLKWLDKSYERVPHTHRE